MNARFVLILAFCGSLYAQQSSQPSLTIYNQDFAVVRQEVPLDLKSGENLVNMNDITMHLEPDSVILRDPTGKHRGERAGAELPRRSGLAGLAALALRRPHD